MPEELHNLPSAPVEPVPTIESPITELLPEQAPSPSLRERASQMIEGYRTWADKYPFAATTAETVAVFVAKRAVAYVGDKIGVNTRNALKGDQLEEAGAHPFKAAAKLVILAPIVEELITRGPSWLKRHTGDKKPSRILDTVMLLGFAAGHAGLVRPAEDSTRPPFVKVGTKDTSIPIVPLMGGANYARVSKKRGFAYGVLSHTLNNGLEGIAAISEVRRRRSNRA